MNHSMNPVKVTPLPVKTQEDLQTEETSHEQFIADLNSAFGPDGNACQQYLDSYAQESQGE